MTDSDIIFQRFLVGLLIAFAVFGVYAYHDHGRTLECRTTAQTNGATAVDAVALCKK